MAEVQHVTAFFSGHVQGVGFRFQTMQVAREFDVSGFVMNLPDGRVQLEAEGRASEVDAFVTAVQERMAGYIRKTEMAGAKREPKFQGFALR